MGKEIKLELMKKGDFLGTKCDFYKDENNNIYMTREQIGQALEYSDARVAITKIFPKFFILSSIYTTVPSMVNVFTLLIFTLTIEPIKSFVPGK